MRKLTAAVALGTAATALLTGTATTAAAATPRVPAEHLAVHSWTLLNEHGPGANPGERLTARVDARAVGGHARGHAVVEHVFIGKGTIRVEFDVDCLTLDGGAVTVTGPVDTATATPVDGSPTTGPAGWHPETGLTFYPADQQGERRVGWAGADLVDPTKPARATKCTPVPAGLWVTEGRTVVHK
ncbi:hypothetical protein AB0E88_33535 [Streptomyces sp. NPDC028635]|uniref:hypothetical protein n=1 Tax=Streptomyces sp. NPDC028635 TaxID=3154800 RepID=UPI0033C33098